MREQQNIIRRNQCLWNSSSKSEANLSAVLVTEYMLSHVQECVSTHKARHKMWSDGHNGSHSA